MHSHKIMLNFLTTTFIFSLTFLFGTCKYPPDGCEINKFHVPCRNDDIFDPAKECQPQPGGGFGGVTTSSPCAKGSMRAHLVKFGDFCDPMLWRFGRRKFDDAISSPENNEKQWQLILGTNIAEDNDFGYSGPCGAGTNAFICPAALCMEVIRLDPDDGITEYVDIYKYDCIGSSSRTPYEGVCTCGHLWSHVDPMKPYRVLNNKSRLVEYKAIRGLNRRLLYDPKTGQCSADKYGHCSLGWPPHISDEFKTSCYGSPAHECVNRSASELGNSIRPFKVKGTGLWYGICDFKFTLENPFGGGASLERNFYLIILLILINCTLFFNDSLMVK